MAISIQSTANRELTAIDIRAEYNSPAESGAVIGATQAFMRDSIGVRSGNFDLVPMNTGKGANGKFFSEFRADILS